MINRHIARHIIGRRMSEVTTSDNIANAPKKRDTSLISENSTNKLPFNVEEDSDESRNVLLLKTVRRNGLLTLNRPTKLNSLDISLVKKLSETLSAWETSKDLVIIQGAGNKAFCTGGDLTHTHLVPTVGGHELLLNIPKIGYPLFCVIHSYKIPYVALMDNITMGGGAGLSIAGKYSVVTERSIFAMPEAAIGLTVDSGCTYSFSRLQGHLGYFLGLTGHRLKGLDILKAGLASHYVPSERLENLRNDLLESNATDIDNIINQYQGNTNVEFSLLPYMDKINEYFSAPTVEEIVSRLQADGSPWAMKAINKINASSSTSLKIIKSSFDRAKTMSFNECAKMEYRLLHRLTAPNSDVVEGVKIVLMDKSYKPKWNPSTLTGVKEEDINRRFELLPPGQELEI